MKVDGFFGMRSRFMRFGIIPLPISRGRSTKEGGNNRAQKRNQSISACNVPSCARPRTCSHPPHSK